MKPDLIDFTGGEAVVIDATVSADNTRDPNQAHFQKVEKYSEVEEILQFVEVNTGTQPRFSASAVNWRGIISPQSAVDLRDSAQAETGVPETKMDQVPSTLHHLLDNPNSGTGLVWGFCQALCLQAELVGLCRGSYAPGPGQTWDPDLLLDRMRSAIS